MGLSTRSYLRYMFLMLIYFSIKQVIEEWRRIFHGCYDWMFGVLTRFSFIFVLFFAAGIEISRLILLIDLGRRSIPRHVHSCEGDWIYPIENDCRPSYFRWMNGDRASEVNCASIIKISMIASNEVVRLFPLLLFLSDLMTACAVSCPWCIYRQIMKWIEESNYLYKE